MSSALTTALVCGMTAGLAASAASQTPPTSSTSSDVTVSVSYEVHRDRLHYGFENPSTIDTPFLVPHRFDQTYVADNQWFVLAARYRLFGELMESEFGLTPQRTAFASDFDAFFDPGGDVVVSGTASDASIHSLRFAQWSEARLWGIPWHLGFVYRRDTTDFHATERLVTHSSPPSGTATPISSHETTISEVQEIPLGVAKQIELPHHWAIAGRVDLSPIALAKLTTRLPDKYPGQDIVFSAKVAAFATGLDLSWHGGRWPLTTSLTYGRTWSYRASNQFDRDTLQVAIHLGILGGAP